jgi:quinol monooxygenase YgiN
MPHRSAGTPPISSHVLEVAEIAVTDPGAFEAAVAMARPHFLAAKGCHGLTLHRVIEHPDIYRLIVVWETEDDHLVLFRQSKGFAIWRALAAPWFARPPVVTHSARVALQDIAA